MLYFFLGNTPSLSQLELSCLLPDTKQLKLGIATSDSKINLPDFANSLGGTRKIAESLDSVQPEQITNELVKHILSRPNKNVGITDYSGLFANLNLYDLKTQVAATRPIRLISMDTQEHELLMLAHQHVLELSILPDPSGQVVIAETVWIFDAKDWVDRDRNKPYRDIARGMLPPKLARILVNLATCGQYDRVVYDPFCGTGTVLSEAMLVGCSVLGSDNNQTAIDGAQINLEWIKNSSHVANPNYSLIQADATHPPFSSFDCIATEPYMGPLLDERNPLPLDKIKDIAKGLDKLYRGALKSWHDHLPIGGRVVITIPSFNVYNRVVPTTSVDTMAALGYNYISSVAYGKPGATVTRNITILEKSNTTL